MTDEDGFKVQNININYVPTGPTGHSFNGAAERKIRNLKQALGSLNMTNTDLDPISFNNLILHLEQEVNSIPIGKRTQGNGNAGNYNSQLFQLLTPRCLQLRDHRRSPRSYITIEKHLPSYLEKRIAERKLMEGVMTNMLLTLAQDVRERIKPKRAEEAIIAGTVVAFQTSE